MKCVALVHLFLFQLVLVEIDSNGFHRTLCDATSLCELGDADIYAIEVEERHRRQSTCDTVTAVLLNRDHRTGLWLVYLNFDPVCSTDNWILCAVLLMK
jgi:hypothetical protein